MRCIILILFICIIFPFSLQAKPGDSIGQKEIKSITSIYFGKVKEFCYPDNQKQENCHKYRICKKDKFNSIKGSEKYYYRLTETFTRYILNFRDETTRYCSGEPETMRAIIYKKTGDKYIEMNTIEASQCYLSIENVAEYGKNTLLKTRCEMSGTGHYTEDSIYLIDNSNVHKIKFDTKLLELPHVPLGREGFVVKNNRIIYSTSSDSRYCQCVASFEAELGVIKDKTGSYTLTYIDGTYRPLFTSRSNAKNKKGLSYYRSKKYKQAIREFLAATELDVSNYQAYSNLGLAYLKSGELDKSIKASQYVYDNADDKLKANAAYNMGAAYERNRNYTLSLKYYTASNKIKSLKIRLDAIERVKNHLK